MPVEMTIAGLLIDTNTDQPILLLKDESGDRAIPIVIGLTEAGAIASELESIRFPRPMTHDLLRSAIEQLGGRILRVLITDLRENTFFANIIVQRERELITIDSRPSDAIALAVRSGAAIYVEDAVVRRVVGSRPRPESDPPDGDAEEGGDFVDFSDAKDDPEKLRAMLEELNPDDFGKYKM